MKLIIQIPCYNEEQLLGTTLDMLPKVIPGIDTVEWLIIDDGSTDRTIEVARAHGVDHIVSHKKNLGLARAFMSGLDTSLKLGADIIVNTDADNQYCSEDITKLIEPILNEKAQIVIGARPIDEIEHFSRLKKLLQKLGSWAVRIASNTDIPDSPSGFRAFSRSAAMQLNVFSEYTYTLETIIQAGIKNLAITSVPIRTNKDKLRPSRLVKSIPSYVWRSITTILRIFVVYRPFNFFTKLSLMPATLGVLLCFRWLMLFIFVDPTRSRAPSLILAAILILVGSILFALGLIGDQLAVNRKLLEEVQLRLRLIEYGSETERKRKP